MPLEERDPTASLRALAHPVRLRILSLLTGADLTATEIAQELEITQANASYHLRQLLACGMLQIAGEERIRGGVAKRYRYDVEADMGDPPWREPDDPRPTPEHLLVHAALAAELRRRGALMRRAHHNYVADAEFWVDPAQWQQLRNRIADASDDLHRVAQPPRSPGTIRVSATVALFEMDAER